MSNENTKEADDVVVDNEEGISNEEADAPTTTADAPETNGSDTNQISAAEDEVSPTLPWWKQKHVLVNSLAVLVIVVVAIVLGVTLSSSRGNSCFDADVGGEVYYYGSALDDAVRAYVDQDCANNEKCEIGQTYGWPINSWCVDNVKDMSLLFFNMDTFNENISGWNTSSVTDMRYMFGSATAFNQDLLWDTSSVTNMDSMFSGASSFNGDVSNFDTSSVTDMRRMFSGATSFNGDVSNFNTSNVTNMWSMLYRATSFNGDVSNFDLSSVTDMTTMFYNASSFDQDLCSWQDSFPYNTASTGGIFFESGCTYQGTPDETQKGPFCASDCQ